MKILQHIRYSIFEEDYSLYEPFNVKLVLDLVATLVYVAYEGPFFLDFLYIKKLA